MAIGPHTDHAVPAPDRPRLEDMAASLVAWMIAAYLTSSPVVPRALAPWINALVALTIGLAASALRPRYRWLRAWTLVTLVLLLLVFVPYPPSPARTAEARSQTVVADPARPDVVLVGGRQLGDVAERTVDDRLRLPRIDRPHSRSIAE